MNEETKKKKKSLFTKMKGGMKKEMSKSSKTLSSMLKKGMTIKGPTFLTKKKKKQDDDEDEASDEPDTPTAADEKSGTDGTPKMPIEENFDEEPREKPSQDDVDSP